MKTFISISCVFLLCGIGFIFGWIYYDYQQEKKNIYKKNQEWYRFQDSVFFKNKIK